MIRFAKKEDFDSSLVEQINDYEGGSCEETLTKYISNYAFLGIDQKIIFDRKDIELEKKLKLAQIYKEDVKLINCDLQDRASYIAEKGFNS